MKNTKRYSNNTSGRNGVYYSKNEKKWKARIGQRHLGTFCTYEEALATREKAEEEYFKEYRRNDER